MQNTRLKVLVGLACALICTLFFYSKFKNDEEPFVVINHGPLPSPSPVPGPVAREKATSPKTKLKVPKKVYLESVGFNKQYYHQLLAQKKLIREFKEQIKLSIELPNNLLFVPLDLEDNIAGIFGASLSGDQHFVVLATAQKVQLRDVTAYLNDSKEAFPFLKNHQLQPDKVIDVKAPDSSGLDSLKIIPATSHSGRMAYAAFAPRKDGKGSYLFVMGAPTPYFDQNESGLELMLESLKTTP